MRDAVGRRAHRRDGTKRPRPGLPGDGAAAEKRGSGPGVPGSLSGGSSVRHRWRSRERSPPAPEPGPILWPLHHRRVTGADDDVAAA